MKTICEHCGKETVVKQKRKKPTEEGMRASELISFYRETFMVVHGREPMDINYGADNKMLAGLVAIATMDSIKDDLEAYVRGESDKTSWYKAQGYRLSLFKKWLQGRIVNGKIEKTVTSHRMWDGLL